MAMFRADAGGLEILASATRARTSEVADNGGAATAILGAHGYQSAADAVGLRLRSVDDWGRGWDRSFVDRIRLLTTPAGAPLTPARRAELIFYATPRGSGGHVGAALARSLLDALEAADLAMVAEALSRLVGLTVDETVSFFEQLGADGTGLVPALLLDAGVSDADLADYLTPLGAALGVATSAGDEAMLWFTGAEMMTGHEGAPASPALYFDFGTFAPEFVLAAAAGALAGYGQEELPLRSPEYQRPDGSIAEPDPRLPLIRAVLAMDVADQVAFIRRVENGGATASLIAPATEWADGGEAVGLLLAGLGTVQNVSIVDVVVVVMRAIADAKRVAPGVALGAATMIAPHLPSLVLATWFGSQVDIAQTALQPALAAEAEGEWLVRRFMTNVLSHNDARSVLDRAFAALVAATISAHFDPDDTESLAGVADDLGVLWELLFGIRLQSNLDEGRILDHDNERMGSVVANATSLLVSGTGLSIASAGFGTWMAEQAAGLVDVADSVEALLGGTSHAEDALLEGFSTQRMSVGWVAVILAAEMHHRGMLELPEELVGPDLDPTAIDESARQLLVSTLVDAGVDVEAWFNDVFAIIAYGVPTPR